MLDFPKISIITPSFNQGRYLEQSIISILDQDYPNLEYIVIDGGSTDNSQEIISNYEDKLDYWVSEPDLGQTDAINKGLTKSTGDIINWINSDDILLPGALMEVAKAFMFNENVALVHGGVILFDDKGKYEIDFGYQDLNVERYLSGMAFPQPAGFFAKSVIEKVGFLDRNLHYGMDYDLYARLSLTGHSTRIDHIIAKYRLHDSSKSIAKSQGFINDWIFVFNKVMNTLGYTSHKRYFSILDIRHHSEKYKLTVISNNKPDERKLIFYFLCYCLKFYYWNSEVYKAKNVWNIIKKDFNTLPIALEKGIPPIGKRLDRLPVWLLSLFKQVKTTFSYS